MPVVVSTTKSLTWPKLPLLESVTERLPTWPWISTGVIIAPLVLPVAGIPVTWPDQYEATSELTEPLKAVASKAGAWARTLLSTVRTRAIEETSTVGQLALEADEPLELLPEPDVDPDVPVAIGVAVPEVESLVEPDVPVAIGVAVPDALVEPEVEVPMLVPFEEVRPETTTACQGTRTWLPPVELLPEPLVELEVPVAAGVPVLEVVPEPEVEPDVPVAAGVAVPDVEPLEVEPLVEPLLEVEPLPVMLTTR